MQNENSFIKFKKKYKSVIIDGEKLYIIEGDILIDENQLYLYFLRRNSEK